MWKVLLADDEAVIVKGLRRLIDWQALGVEVAGEVTDGLSALRVIREVRPDLVVSDIRMPGLTGLELMELCREEGQPAKFIFISGYEEFEYARKALSGGAVEYLLKPVSAQDLEKAVRKALGLMSDRSAAALLRNSSVPVQDFFNQLTADRAFVGSGLYEDFTTLLGGKEDPVFWGLCFGLTEPAAVRLSPLPYERRLLQTFMAFNSVRDELERTGYGCFLRKDEGQCCLLGIFSPGEEPEDVLLTVLDKVEARTGCRLRVGLGRPCTRAECLKGTYEDALRAYELYYFQQRDVLRAEGEREPGCSNEDFDMAVRQAFQAMVSKDEGVLEAVDRVLDMVEDLHYGNRGAAFNRVMLFTGDLCQQLYASHLLTGSFAQRQDALQRQLEACPTFPALRAALKEYYAQLLPGVYHTARHKSTGEIYRVQEYIEEHYNEDLSLKALAEIACVSPSYFSACFKAETGQNYKAYLTRVRMDHAMRLVLSTDLKTYEIAERVGYNNVRRFVDAFRAAFGSSPMDHRKRYKK